MLFMKKTMRASKKAILMWFTGGLARRRVFIVFVLLILAAAAFLYLKGLTTLNILYFGEILFWPYARLLIFLLALGLSVALLFFVLRAAGDALLKHAAFSYELQPEAIKIVTGIFGKKESYLPYKNIQSVDVRVSGREYIWGLADVLIFTPGEGGENNPAKAEGYIEGLRYQDAVALKDELLKKIK